jgi:hypothetical protein
VSARIALPKPMMPCSKFLLLATIFPKIKMFAGGGSIGGGVLRNFFPDIKKKGSKNFFVQIPVATWVKPLFLDQYL